MTTDNTRKCFGCGKDIAIEVGYYYCPACVEVQMEELGRLREAFDAYHEFADAVARSNA